MVDEVARAHGGRVRIDTGTEGTTAALELPVGGPGQPRIVSTAIVTSGSCVGVSVPPRPTVRTSR